MNSGRWHGLTQDVRIAVKMIGKSPLLSVTIILSIAVAIGANLTALGVADAIFWRQLPAANADRLIALYNRAARGSGTYSGLSYPEFEYLRSGNEVLEGLATYVRMPLVLETSNNPESVTGEQVSSNFFSVLGIRTVIGRGFIPRDDRSAEPSREIILSHGLWKSRFAADPNILGKVVRVERRDFTIVGVADPEFRGVLLDWQSPPQLWIPIAVTEPVFFLNPRTFDAWNFHSMMTVGRLKPEVSLDRAAATLRELDERMTADHPARAAAFNGRYDFTLDVLPLQRARFFPAYRDEIQSYVEIVGVVVLIVLAMACLNMANLTIARSEARRAEFAIRLALGATRLRLIRQSVVESLMLTLSGGAASLLVAAFFWSVLASIDGAAASPRFGRPFRVALPPEFRIDTQILLVAVALSVVSGVVLGLWPLLRARASNVSAVMKSASGDSKIGVRVRGALVMLQTAISVVLIAGAGLFVQTVINFESIDRFIERDRIGLANAELPADRYAEFLDNVRRIAGVEGAVLKGVVSARDRAGHSDVRVQVSSLPVSDGYFRLMGIPVLRGRDFQSTDGPTVAAVAVVNETFVRHFGLQANPVGEFIELDSARGGVAIIGVVMDTNLSPRSPVPPVVYTSMKQFPQAGMTLYLRPAGSLAEALPAVRDALRAIDATVPLTNSRTLAEDVDATLSRERLTALLVTALGALALLLTLAGLYGIIAFAVETRKREIGIRMAVGASATSVVRLVLSQSLSIAVTGTLVGLIGAIAATRAIASLLFRVSPADPLFLSVAVLLTIVSAVAACIVPAWRAARVEPSSVLRTN